MSNLINNTANGMNIFGQGPKVMLFTLPALAAAIAAHLLAPEWVEIPLPSKVMVPVGGALILLGLVLWAAAMAQLLAGFPKGKLVTTGAYGVCRNPIYSSFGLLVLPGLSLVLGTWVYVAAGAVLCLGVRILIRKEERDLLRVFGEEYRGYTVRVHRLIPLVRPRSGLADPVGPRA